MGIVKNSAIYFLLALCSLVLLGCSQKAEENKSIEEVKAEAEKMDTAQLRAMAMEHKEAIMAKNEEIGKLVARLEGIPVADKLGDEARKIKAEIERINKSQSALGEQFVVYYNKLKEKGGDTSGL